MPADAPALPASPLRSTLRRRPSKTAGSKGSCSRSSRSGNDTFRGTGCVATIGPGLGVPLRSGWKRLLCLDRCVYQKLVRIRTSRAQEREQLEPVAPLVEIEIGHDHRRLVAWGL